MILLKIIPVRFTGLFIRNRNGSAESATLAWCSLDLINSLHDNFQFEKPLTNSITPDAVNFGKILTLLIL